jgi:hypothetical protein
MLEFGSSVARESPWRIASFVCVATCALRCQSPAEEGLFDESRGGSTGAPTAAGAGGVPADFPSWQEIWGLGAGGWGGSGESSPPIQGFAGTAAVSPPAMGPTDSMGLPDVNAPAAADAGVTPIDMPPIDMPPIDMPIDDCVLGEFQAPELLTGLEQGINPALTVDFWAPSLSADGRTLFFAVGVNGVDELIATATRSDRSAGFSSPAPLADIINSAGLDGSPLPSADGLSLYFYSTRPGGLGDRDVWLSRRADVGSAFAAPTLLAGVNSGALDHLPWVSADELTMLLVTNRGGGVGLLDIWIARRNSKGVGFSNIAPLNGVNSTAIEGRAVLSNDALTIYFASERPGGFGAFDLWVATRGDSSGTFSQAMNLAALNSASFDQDPFLSADERELLFVSGRDGRIRLWRSIRDCE